MGSAPEPVLLSHGLDRLTPDEATEFRSRLQALCEEFGRHGADDGTTAGRAPDARPYGLVVAFYPTVAVRAPHQGERT